MKKHPPNQPKVNKELRKKKFNFRKRGMITKEEEAELVRTHKNIFDWVNHGQVQELPSKVVEEVVLEGKEDALLRLESEKAERLQRVALKRATLERNLIGKGMVEELLEKLAQSELKEMAKDWLEEVIDEVAKKGLLNKIYAEIEENNIRGVIEKRMRMKEEEAMMLVLREEEREMRILKQRMRMKAWR